ncbi:MAG: M48 family peptidase, partial [Flavobacteriaceae bacterium]|nr:M48 family peptidase [Flavobacteriaceae bacterium]
MFGRRSGGFKIRLLIGAGIVLFSLFKYYSQRQTNPYTGKKQSIALTAEEEIAIGLRSAPHMAQQHGGLYPDQKAQDLVDRIGERLVNNSIARETPYKYDFHLLRDPQAINAFALPGGQIFITYALFS